MTKAFAKVHIFPQNTTETRCERSQVFGFSIGHFTVMDGSEAGVDLVLLQTFLLYYVNQVILMLTSIFQGQFP